MARGGRPPHTLDQSVLAHSSPVYVDMDGRRVARAADGQWCLDFLDSFQQLADRHGHFDPATRKEHFGDLVAVIDRARDEFRRVAASKR